MITTRLTALAAAVLLASSCAHHNQTEQTTGGAASPEANLLRVEAERRSAAIHNVKYELAIDLDEKNDQFSGVDHVSFELVGSPKDLFFDFKDGARIESYKINGMVAPVTFAKHRLVLPEDRLNKGTNTVEIAYRQPYSHEGRGLHRFVDPEDARVYLYTQFEAFDAHQMFPCFDQPDMKATMKMTVKAPDGWEVVTTTRESEKTVGPDFTIWHFPETPKLSTYLFSLHAGPYAKWETKAGSIPLRLFARQSLKKYVLTDDWFKPTQQGLAYYGDYFDYPYPFKKYDQLIVPEFNAGAMENVGAVTFSERFVHRGPTTRKDRESLASVILHEMGHMWFGDLVTMQWWNGTWLNETFATFASGLSLAGATEFKESWQSFNAGKWWAYWQDQLVTTHPIDFDVPDTNSAFANFDSITYSKGASTMKELRFLLGDRAFRDGLRYYFKKYAYQNTRLEDFIGALEHSSHRKLDKWAKSWLQTAGLDTVQASYSCREGRISRFALTVEPPEGQPRSRVHAAMIGLYQDAEGGGGMKAYKLARVEYGAASTDVSAFVGQRCPDFVFPNDQDEDYVKVRFDNRSLDKIKGGVSQLSDPLARMMTWQNLYGMVRDVKMKPQDFLQLVKADLPKEQDYNAGEFIIRNLPNIVYYLPQATADQQKEYAHAIYDLEQVLWKKAESSTPGSDWQRLALNGFTQISETTVGRDRLVGMLNGSVQPKGYVLDVDQRWTIIIHLASQGDKRVQPILAEQRRNDASDRGIQNAYAADAAAPTLDKKIDWINRIKEHNDLSFTQKRQVLWAILPHWQDEIRARLAADYYRELPDVVRTHDLSFAGMYSGSLLPTTCSDASVSALDNFLKTHGEGMPFPVLKALRTGHQEDSRCVSIRKFASGK